MLKVTCHGGQCCGIKHISGFPLYPNHGKEWSLEADNTFDDEDSSGEDVSTRLRFFQDAAPEEPLWDRFDRMLAYIKKERPGGIVECVLAKEGKEGHDWDQIALHGPKLIERGFKVVNEVDNSNSYNICRVYHLNMLYDHDEE